MRSALVGLSFVFYVGRRVVCRRTYVCRVVYLSFGLERRRWWCILAVWTRTRHDAGDVCLLSALLVAGGGVRHGVGTTVAEKEGKGGVWRGSREGRYRRRGPRSCNRLWVVFVDFLHMRSISSHGLLFALSILLFACTLTRVHAWRSFDRLHFKEYKSTYRCTACSPCDRRKEMCNLCT